MINFDNIEEQSLNNFFGGSGSVKARIFQDANCKIMKAVLEKGVSIGTHTHDSSSEVVYVLKGTAHFVYNGADEFVQPGQVHYCPKGNTHTVSNDYDEPLEIYCVVPVQ